MPGARLAARRCAGRWMGIDIDVHRGAVADLIVVLDTDDEAVARQAPPGSGCAVTAATMQAVAAIVNEGFFKQSWPIFVASIVGVITLPFPGQAGVHQMMEVITPLGI